MTPPEEKLLFENALWRLTTRRAYRNGTEAGVEGGILRISRNGAVREQELPKGVPAGFPRYVGDIPVLVAAYNCAAQELTSIRTEEGLLRAGASWQGVWTRDTAYAAAMGGALAAPEDFRRSLMSRVRNGIILQDTGTGGGWPVSTDRVAWALGAWAVYRATGDREWLEQCADIITNTLEQDARVLPQDTPLQPGETSFIDWREQSYPDWATPAHIGAGFAFGTNVVHAVCRRLHMRMLRLLGRKAEADRREEEYDSLVESINNTFWSRANQQYGMLYTLHGYLDERVDSLGNALAVRYGIAGEHGERAMQALPRSAYGTPVFSPYKAGQQASYHNRAIWPFVEGWVLQAHAELRDCAGFAFSMASLLGAFLVNGSHKENFNAESGEADETVQNSDSQLWSICGMLGAVYHGLFGLQFEGNNLVFNPCVPKEYAGSHWITGLHIGKMTLSVHLKGYGTEICSVLVNGKPGLPTIPLNAEGNVQIELELMPADEEQAVAHFPAAVNDLPEPQWDNPTEKELRWLPVPGASSYCVYRNGRAYATVPDCHCNVSRSELYFNSFCVQAVNGNTVSCLSRPFECSAPASIRLLKPHRIGLEAEYAVENGQAWLDTRPCTSRLDFELATLAAGTYRLRLLYCNATNSLRDGDTCALRELLVDDEYAGMVVLPHNTEAGNWEDYSLSASHILELPGGQHTFSLRFSDRCTNSHGQTNQCMIRHLELTRIL